MTGVAVCGAGAGKVPLLSVTRRSRRRTRERPARCAMQVGERGAQHLCRLWHCRARLCSGDCIARRLSTGRAGRQAQAARARRPRLETRRELQGRQDQQLDGRPRRRPARGHLPPLRRRDRPQPQRPGELRVLPVVTQGATDNVKDLLYLKGIDIAITNADVLEHFKNIERIPNIEKRINFISEMVISEVHVVVRPEINSIKDLEGKKVSFHTPGAGPSTTAPILFQRLGINVEFVYVNNAIALEKMKTGEIAGARQQRRQAARPAHQVQERRRLQVPAGPLRPVRRVLHPRRAHRPRTIRASSSPARRSRRSACRRCSPSTTGRARATASGACSASSSATSTASRSSTCRPYHPKWKSVESGRQRAGMDPLLSWRRRS